MCFYGAKTSDNDTPLRARTLPLVLASNSPFRRELLKKHGILAQSRAPNCDEQSIQAADPNERALARAELKAASLGSLPDSWILGCDQTLYHAGQFLSKAPDRRTATATLQSLSGQIHTLHTAQVLIRTDGNGKTLDRVARVLEIPMNMRSLSEAEIAAYVDTDEWRDTVGCYRYEGVGYRLFARPAHSAGYYEPSAIVGLSIHFLLEDLAKLDFPDGSGLPL